MPIHKWFQFRSLFTIFVNSVKKPICWVQCLTSRGMFSNLNVCHCILLEVWGGTGSGLFAVLIHHRICNSISGPLDLKWAPSGFENHELLCFACGRAPEIHTQSVEIVTFYSAIVVDMFAQGRGVRFADSIFEHEPLAVDPSGMASLIYACRSSTILRTLVPLRIPALFGEAVFAYYIDASVLLPGVIFGCLGWRCAQFPPSYFTQSLQMIWTMSFEMQIFASLCLPVLYLPATSVSLMTTGKYLPINVIICFRRLLTGLDCDMGPASAVYYQSSFGSLLIASDVCALFPFPCPDWINSTLTHSTNFSFQQTSWAEHPYWP